MRARDVEEVLDEVRLLWHAMVRAGEQLHFQERITLGMRAVLEALLREGPLSVPTIARRRLVTRQHVQTLVNALHEHHLVAFRANPAHQTSPLVALTPAGRSAIRRMKEREARLYGRLVANLADERLREAAASLRALRQALTTAS